MSITLGIFFVSVFRPFSTCIVHNVCVMPCAYCTNVPFDNAYMHGQIPLSENVVTDNDWVKLTKHHNTPLSMSQHEYKN